MQDPFAEYVRGGIVAVFALIALWVLCSAGVSLLSSLGLSAPIETSYRSLSSRIDAYQKGPQWKLLLVLLQFSLLT